MTNTAAHRDLNLFKPISFENVPRIVSFPVVINNKDKIISSSKAVFVISKERQFSQSGKKWQQISEKM